ncbi:MAG: site-specific integrase [Candidatus Melainabacteria bacterium]|nr:site-specific integrase [Candidatus Melainabacteria bacterium]
MSNELIELSKLIRAVDLEKIKESFPKLKDIKIKRTISRVIDTLSLDDLNKALGTIETLSTNRVNKEIMKSLFIFAFYTALRASEIINLEITDIDLKADRLLVRQGKGNKDRYVGINRELKPHLESYLNEIRPESKSLKAFLLSDGREFTLDRIEKRVKYIFKKTGLKGLLHAFRRGSLTYYAARGVPLSHLQIVAGHSSVNTTASYVNHKVQEVINAQINW